MKQTLAKAGKTIHVTDEALELIVTQGYSLAFGARFLKRVIDERIKLPISARWKEGSHFEVMRRRGSRRRAGAGSAPTIACRDVADRRSA